MPERYLGHDGWMEEMNDEAAWAAEQKPHQELIAENRALIERVRANRPRQEARARIARQRLENARRLLAKHLERR